jgi:hypothetical protein
MMPRTRRRHQGGAVCCDSPIGRHGAYYHWDRGWDSDEIKDRWAGKAEALAADVRAELGMRARLVVEL